MRRFSWCTAVIRCAILFPIQFASAQSGGLTVGDSIRRLQRAVPITDAMALSNWTLRIFARRDGWVELDLESTLRNRSPTPWLARDQFFPRVGEPVRSRGYFTPDEVHRAVSLADSLIDGSIPREAMAARFRNEWPRVLDMRNSDPLFPMKNVFSWYMGSVREGSGEVEFGLGTCFNVSEAPAQLMGRGVTRSIAEYQGILRALDSAATTAAQFVRTPQAMRADLIDGSEAACQARPKYDVPLPAYPPGGKGRIADVRIDAVVDTDGRIVPASVHASGGDSVFVAEAIHAIEQWRFAPALLTKATPVAQRVRIHVHFAPSLLTEGAVGALMDQVVKRGGEMLVLSRPAAP
jgi:TonB family protein